MRTSTPENKQAVVKFWRCRTDEEIVQILILFDAVLPRALPPANQRQLVTDGWPLSARSGFRHAGVCPEGASPLPMNMSQALPKPSRRVEKLPRASRLAQP